MSVLTDVPFIWKRKTTDIYGRSVMTMTQSHSSGVMHLTDGRGAIRFFSAILDAYFENNANPVFNTVLSDQGLEQIADPAQKPLSCKKQPKGYDIKYMPSEKHANHRYRCHVVKIPTQDVLNVSHKADASPAAVLPPLFSKAVRRFISEKADNRTVSCSIVIDARTPMHIDTMHNCIITKQISYVDRFDEMDSILSAQSTVPSLTFPYRKKT